MTAYCVTALAIRMKAALNLLLHLAVGHLKNLQVCIYAYF